MKAIIQHNFTSGLGDAIVAVYEYIKTANKLIDIGYEVDLRLNLFQNSYIENEDFFEIFNKNIFNVFKTINFDKEPIRTINFENLVRVYTLASANPGMHWWDLFLENPNSDTERVVSVYPQQNDLTPNKIDLFNDKIIKEFKLASDIFLSFNEYDSIYFRTYDQNENISLYEKYKKVIFDIIKSNKKIFVCSNNFQIKKELKSLGFNNCFMYEIPEESKFGNHFYNRKLDFENPKILFNRTKYTIFDMLSLSESKEIHFFTEWGRTSNFLFLSKINKVIINNY